MKNLKLPIQIDPIRSASRRLECDGVFLVSGMERLQASCDKSSEFAEVNVRFDLDERGLVVVSGSGSVKVSLICQRCLDVFEQLLEINFQYSPAKNEAAAEEIPSYYDVLFLDENGEINLRDLVEEEFILMLPLIPRHDTQDCSVPTESVWGELPQELEKPNPFDVLKKLK